jgi:hypothetical protein
MRRRLTWHGYVISLRSVAICIGPLLGIPRLQARGPAVAPTASAIVTSYDAVSIKPYNMDNGRVNIRIDDGNFDALNASLKTMILGAYNVKETQLFGLPRWGDASHFDIKAKIIDPEKKQLAALTPKKFTSIQQPILSERF